MSDSAEVKDKIAKPSGILTGAEISKYKIIVEKSEDGYCSEKKCFQFASYDLRVGDSHYVYDGSSEEHNWSLVFIGDNDKYNELNKNEPHYEKPTGNMGELVIPPYGSAIIQLEEVIDTKTVAQDHKLLVVGRFDLKLKRVYQALISQQATQVEPYYYGKLYCFVYNLSDKAVVLSHKEPIATIEFSYVSTMCDYKAEDKYLDEFSYPGGGIKDVRWFSRHNRLPSECGLARFKQTLNNSLMDGLESIPDEIEQQFNTWSNKKETIESIAARIKTYIDTKIYIIGIVAAAILGFFNLSFYTDLKELRVEFDFFKNQVESNQNSKLSEITQNQFSFYNAIDNLNISLILWTIFFLVFIFISLCYLRKNLRRNRSILNKHINENKQKLEDLEKQFNKFKENS